MRSLEEQRRFFASGATLPLEVRMRWLKALGREIRTRQEEIAAALLLPAAIPCMCESADEQGRIFPAFPRHGFTHSAKPQCIVL